MKCVCGKQFDSMQAYYGHIGSCLKYYDFNNIPYTDLLIKRKSDSNQDNLWDSTKHFCEYCGKLLVKKWGSGRFCNINCSNSYVAQKYTKKSKGNCLCCGIELKHTNRKFCSNKCQQQYKYQLYIQDWLSGKIMPNNKNDIIPGPIVRYVWEKFGGKCSMCGWCEINPTTGKSPLEIDHIDGNYRNNSESNLRLLCPNCHSLTPTYKALNVGKGRGYRN